MKKLFIPHGAWWRTLEGRLRRLEAKLGSVARRKWLAILIAGLMLLLSVEALRQSRVSLGRQWDWLTILATLLTPVVGAREMDPSTNRELLAYFRNRQAWLVQPNAVPVLLGP